MNNNIRFTIVIIHRNGFRRLKDTLDSAINSTEDSDEILIVDNASTDSSIEKIKQDKTYKDVQIIKNTCNTGYAYSCNQVYSATMI